MQKPARAALILIASGLMATASGCASLDQTGVLLQKWSLRGVGAVGAFALHEACHLAVGAAMGADIDVGFRGSSLYLGFGDLSPKQHQGVAIAGNACTGIAAEIIVDTGAHKKSDIAWGAAAFHAANVFGYAFSTTGDAEHWTGSGGSDAGWKSINAVHASRIGTQLALDSKYGQYLTRRWRGERNRLPPLTPDPLDFETRLDTRCSILPASLGATPGLDRSPLDERDPLCLATPRLAARISVATPALQPPDLEP